jgi:hypothetical protein
MQLARVAVLVLLLGAPISARCTHDAHGCREASSASTRSIGARLLAPRIALPLRWAWDSGASTPTVRATGLKLVGWSLCPHCDVALELWAAMVGLCNGERDQAGLLGRACRYVHHPCTDILGMDGVCDEQADSWWSVPKLLHRALVGSALLHGLADALAVALTVVKLMCFVATRCQNQYRAGRLAGGLFERAQARLEPGWDGNHIVRAFVVWPLVAWTSWNVLFSVVFGSFEVVALAAACVVTTAVALEALAHRGALLTRVVFGMDGSVDDGRGAAPSRLSRLRELSSPKRD